MLRLSLWTRIFNNQNIVRSNVNAFLTLRYHSGNEDESQEATTRETYRDFLERNMSEAQKSLLFYVKSESQINKVVFVCEKYGSVKNVFFSRPYLNTTSLKENILVVEMENLSEAVELLQNVCDRPLKSEPSLTRPFIDIDFASVPQGEIKYSGKKIIKNVYGEKIRSLIKTDDKFWIWWVYQAEKFQKIDIKLRYIALSYINSVIKTFWRNAYVEPYGSSMSGFGSASSDLDLSFNVNLEKNSYMSFKNIEQNPMGKLEALEHLFRFCALGFTVTNIILNAQFPVLKFTVDYIPIKCDLCINNELGFRSTKLLFLAGRLHGLTLPMATVLRKWAQDLDILKYQAPSPRISNFALALLVIFFLQKVKIDGFDLMPPMNILLEDDKYTLMGMFHNSNCDSTKVKSKLEVCLYRFFQFYAEFEFDKNTICVGTGKIIPSKLYKNPVNIRNPVDPTQNVARSITRTELVKIQKYFKKCCEMYEKEKRFTIFFFDANHFKDWKKTTSKDTTKREEECVAA